MPKPKMSTKSAKYEIRYKTYNGFIFGLSLYSHKQNAIIIEVLVHATSLLFQYDLTIPQMNLLNAIQKLCDNPPFKVPINFSETA